MSEYKIGENIKKRRGLLKKNQGEIAEKIGVSKSQLSKWENEMTSPSRTNFIKLSYALEISPEALVMGRTDEAAEQCGKKRDKKFKGTMIILSILAIVLFLLLIVNIIVKLDLWFDKDEYVCDILYEKTLEDGTREIRQLVKSRNGEVWGDIITHQSNGTITDCEVLEIIHTGDGEIDTYECKAGQGENRFYVQIFFDEADIRKSDFIEVRPVR